MSNVNVKQFDLETTTQQLNLRFELLLQVIQIDNVFLSTVTQDTLSPAHAGTYSSHRAQQYQPLQKRVLLYPKGP